eukprot:UN14165
MSKSTLMKMFLYGRQQQKCEYSYAWRLSQSALVRDESANAEGRS